MNEHNKPTTYKRAIPKMITIGLFLAVMVCASIAPAMAAATPYTGDFEIGGPYDADVIPGPILLDPLTIIIMYLHTLFPWIF